MAMPELKTIQLKQRVKIQDIRIPAPSENKPEGRPPEITPELVRKLEGAFSIGATVTEALIHAGIAKSTYYDFLKIHPELSDTFELLRKRPILKARNNIAMAINNGDLAISKWYLKHKCPEEFNSKYVDQPDNSITIQVVNYQDTKQLSENLTAK